MHPESTLLRRPPPRWLVASAIGALTSLAYALLSVLRYRKFTVTSWDNAIFEQALQGYAWLNSPIVAVKGPGYNILGDHFSPIYIVLAPVYRMFPHGQTLLIAQAVLIGVSAGVVAAVAIRFLGWTLGVMVAVGYAVSFGIQSAVIADFHEVAFAVPLLALAGKAYLDQNYRQTMMWAAPLVLVKEDMGLTVAAIGVVLWWIGERRYGLFLVGGGILATIVTVAWIIPSFNTADGYDYVSNLGGDQGIVATAFAEPATKLGTLAITFAITGFAAVFSRWAIVVFPTFGWRFVGDVEFYWGTDWHYSLLLMPIVFIAMIDALSKRPKVHLAAASAAAVFTGIMFSGSPLTTLFDSETWRPSPRAVAAHAAMDAIPEGMVVETDLGLLTHLVSDHDVYWRGTIAGVVPDVIVFDAAISPENAAAYGTQRYGQQFAIVFEQDGYSVAIRQ